MAESRKKAGESFPHYPLTDFLVEGNASKIGDLFLSLIRQQEGKASKFTEAGGGRAPTGRVRDVGSGGVEIPEPIGPDRFGGTEPPYETLHRLMEGVSLCRFNGSVVNGRRRYYAYDVGFSSGKTVGFVLPKPLDTLLVFGGERIDLLKIPTRFGLPPLERYPVAIPQRIDAKARVAREEAAREKSKLKDRPGVKGTAPPPRTEKTEEEPAPHVCDFNARVYVSETGRLQILQIFGPTIRFYFSPGLIRPVRKNSQGNFVPTGERQMVRLGNERITLMRGQRPRLSAPLSFDDNLVQISGQGLIAKLKSVTLGGTSAEPRLVFDQTELIY
jgi:hypothetical protein